MGHHNFWLIDFGLGLIHNCTVLAELSNVFFGKGRQYICISAPTVQHLPLLFNNHIQSYLAIKFWDAKCKAPVFKKPTTCTCYMWLRLLGLSICKNITLLKRLMIPSFFTYRTWWVLPRKTASERKHAAEKHGLGKNYRNATVKVLRYLKVFEDINNKSVYAQYSNTVSSEWHLL